MKKDINNPKKSPAVEKRQEADKTLVLEQLKQVPIVQIACQKAGISRATFYRWKNESEAFAKEVDEAISEGVKFINDLSESQLINLIKNQQMPAISFWLKHHHKAYTTKVEVTAEVKNLNQQLTPEQQQVVDEALRLTALTSSDENSGEERNKTNE